MPEPVLKVENIIKSFPGVKALDNVKFDVRPGEVHALCGENGAGKSTMMHILAGVYRPEAGSIFLDGKPVVIEDQKHANNLGISIVYQERSLVAGLSVAENIFAGYPPTGFLNMVDRKKMWEETRRLLGDLGLDIDPKVEVGSLSSALQQMVEIAKALAHKPRVLILDEPTAAITQKEVAALFNLIKLLKKNGMAIIYISHRLAEIFEIADRVTVFKDGQYVETANVSEIDSMWIVGKMVGRELTFHRVERKYGDEKVLECNGLCGEAFKDISFHLYKGEILGFAGLAGAGRTEVMRAIFGADPMACGEVRIKGEKRKINSCVKAIEHGIGYLPEDRKDNGCFLEMSVMENIVATRLQDVSSRAMYNEKKAGHVAEKFRKQLNIITPGIMQKVRNLSGGNQQKVVLSKWLMVNPEILIADEPTRGIDVGAKAEVYSILRKLADNGTSIIVISSELPELLSISDRIYVMHEGRIAGELGGCEATEETIVRIASGVN